MRFALMDERIAGISEGLWSPELYNLLFNRPRGTKEFTMKQDKESLTREQTNALTTFARRHGRYWKKMLGDLWSSGRDDREPEGPLLRQIRNGGGHSLLVGFRLPIDGR